MNSYSIYTDGSCRVRTTKEGSWAFAIIDDSTGELVIEDSGWVSPKTTSPKMEMKAVIEGVSAAINSLPHGSITIYSDSEVVIKGITEWIHNWKKRNWKSSSGGYVKNISMWKTLEQLTQIIDVDFTWVKGHNGNQWNEYVHNLADQAVYNKTK